MDWTGGTRRRYAGKGKGNAVVQKQKAHFAKARAAAGYQIIPETYRLSAAASREHQPQMVAPHGALEHIRKSESCGTSRGRGSPNHDANRIARKRTHTKHMALVRPTVDASATEEEIALAASRKRLLARDDWLGLAATRPARFRYPSNRGKERVGKRRKIDKSKARKHRPAEEQHAVALPFEERLVPCEPMMSGAIGYDDIQIKVGTDAFLSQTQQSRRSHNSVNTSVRPISTDFGPISEESMLLKADSDGFEVQDGDGNDRFEHFQAAASPEIREQVLDEQNYNEQYDYGHLPDHQQDTLATGSDNLFEYDDEQSPFLDDSSNKDATLQSVNEDFWPMTQGGYPVSDTGADYSARANITQTAYALPDRLQDHQTTIDSGYPAQSNFGPTAISSPSPSHRRVLQLVNQAPVAESALAQEEDGQDELWRQFVVGSQSSQSSHGGGRRANSEELLPAQPSSSKPLSEQIRSDRMTTGGSVYATRECATTDSPDDVSSQDRTNVSLMGHATNVNHERDGIAESGQGLRKTTNMHSNVNSGTMSKRRHEPRKRTKYAPVPRTFPRVSTNASTLAPPRSIFDLPSSDD